MYTSSIPIKESKYVLDFSPNSDGSYNTLAYYQEKLAAIPEFTSQPDFVDNNLTLLCSSGDGYNFNDGGLTTKANYNTGEAVTNIEYYKNYTIHSCLRDYDRTQLNDNIESLDKLNTTIPSKIRILCLLDILDNTQLTLFKQLFYQKLVFIDTLDTRVYIDERPDVWQLLRDGGIYKHNTNIALWCGFTPFFEGHCPSTNPNAPPHLTLLNFLKSTNPTHILIPILEDSKRDSQKFSIKRPGLSERLREKVNLILGGYKKGRKITKRNKKYIKKRKTRSRRK